MLLALIAQTANAQDSATACDDRTQLSAHPRVYHLRSILSDAECDQLIALGKPRLQVSEMGAADSPATSGEDQPASQRASSSMFFDSSTDEDEPLLKQLRQRWAAASQVPLESAEPTQLARYKVGGSYGFHLDASAEVPRTATLLIYLSDGFDGGETCFPRVPDSDGAGSPSAAGIMRPLGKLAAAGMLARELSKVDEYCESRAVLRVTPRKGDGLLFYPLLLDGTPDPDAVHAGCAVRGTPGASANKWIAQQWFSVVTT